LTDVSLVRVTIVRNPLIVLCDEHTVDTGRRSWIAAPPVAVLHVNYTSVYNDTDTVAQCSECTYRLCRKKQPCDARVSRSDFY